MCGVIAALAFPSRPDPEHNRTRPLKIDFFFDFIILVKNHCTMKYKMVGELRAQTTSKLFISSAIGDVNERSKF